MSAPTLDTPPGSQTGTSAGQRRHRKQLVLVASALMVVAIAVGTSLAIATRPVAHQTPAAAGQPAAADQQPDQGSTAQPPAKPESSTAPAAAAPALGNGDHDAYITKVDRAGNRIVVDVVQVFHDDKAVQAAVADGKAPSDAKYLTTWVRNENPRLRTLPLAANLVVQLRGTCDDESAKNRDALLTKLAANARLDGTYYYTLTVRDGQVRRIQEQLAVNAC